MNWLTILISGYVLTWLLIPHLFLQKKRPVSTLAWLWAILLFPYVGAATYLVIGTDRMKRKRLRRQKNFDALKAQDETGKLPAGRTSEIVESLPIDDQRLLDELACVNEIPTSSADEIVILPDSETFYPALAAAIAEAKHHIHIEFYTWQPDDYGRRFLGELVKAARRGVEVRLLLDEIGCSAADTSFFDPLVKAGGKFSWFLTLNPLRNRFFLHLRNHRKVQVFDGRLAFVGGMNIGEEYAGKVPHLSPWHDMQVSVTGPVVSILQNSFADDWYFGTEEKLEDDKYFPDVDASPGGHAAQVIVGGPDSPRSPVLKSVVALINKGAKRVWITTGYFVPNDLMLTALQLAAARGADVRLLIAEKNDHPLLVAVGRSFYEELLEFGVRIFEYSKGMNHAKVLSIDQEWLSIGSANFDIRSMRLNFELNLVFHSEKHAAQIDPLLEKYFDDSDEVVLEEFGKRPRPQKWKEAAVRPLSPML